MIAGGGTTRQAARVAGLDSPLTAYNWLRNHPEFREAYVAACWARDIGLRLGVGL